MTRAVNDNLPETTTGGPGTSHPWPSTIRPRDEEAPGAKVIALQIRSPVSDGDLDRASAVLKGGQSVRLWSAKSSEANVWAWKVCNAYLDSSEVRP